MRPNLILFTYLHLAADEELTRAMLESGVTGIAYETVEDRRQGGLPLLEPMSEVAGRMAAQVVSHYSGKTSRRARHADGWRAGGRSAAHVVILGAGTVGTNAAKIALGMGARVTLLDINLDRLRYLDDVLDGQAEPRSTPISINISRSILTADALIGSVLITGRARADAGHTRYAPLDAQMAALSLMSPLTKAAASKRRARPHIASPPSSSMASCIMA